MRRVGWCCAVLIFTFTYYFAPLFLCAPFLCCVFFFRAELLCAFFFLMACLCYIEAAQRGGGGGKGGGGGGRGGFIWLFLSWVIFVWASFEG